MLLYGTHEGPLKSYVPPESEKEESDEEQMVQEEKQHKNKRRGMEIGYTNLDFLRMNMLGFGAPRDYSWYKDTQYQNIFLGRKPKYDNVQHNFSDHVK
jgi:hypothetical protein